MKNGILLLMVVLGFVAMYVVLEYKTRKASEESMASIQTLYQGYVIHENTLRRQMQWDYTMDSTLTKQVFAAKDSIR